ncbi:MAG: hypothetical protein FVQ80_11055 [Planctomycetes bacterium]|nr:hypothetical protein [Planctomycetota bacterium]
MAEPTATLTIEDLVLRVAREAGMAYYGSDGQQEAMVPIDAHDIDLCRRIVNDGIRLFVKAAPANGWRWTRRLMRVQMGSTEVTGTADSAGATTLVDATLSATYTADDDLNTWWIYITSGTGDGSYAQITDYTTLTGTITVADWLDSNGNAGGTDPVATDTFIITQYETVDGDISRYPLPENFSGSVDGQIAYEADTNHSPIIEWVDESFIRRRRAVTVVTSYPRYAAIFPLEPNAAGAGPKRRFEIRFDPKPSSDDVVEFPFTVGFDRVWLQTGTNSAGDTTSLTDSTIANHYPDDYFNGWVIKIVDGTGKFSNATVTDYTSTTGKFDVADWLAIDGTAGGLDPTVAGAAYVVQPLINTHPAGYRFDDTVESACLAKAETHIDDMAGRGFYRKWLDEDLPDAKKLDARAAPRSVGTMNKSGKGSELLRDRTFNDITFNA